MSHRRMQNDFHLGQRAFQVDDGDIRHLGQVEDDPTQPRHSLQIGQSPRWSSESTHEFW
jgi:hypothetical protein